MATKVRALYQRRKGRDLYDLWKANELNPNWVKIVNLFLKYMDHSKTPIHRDQFMENFENKMGDSRFNRDMGNLVNSTDNYDWNKAGQFVKDKIISFVPQSKAKQKKLKKKTT